MVTNLFKEASSSLLLLVLDTLYEFYIRQTSVSHNNRLGEIEQKLLN